MNPFKQFWLWLMQKKQVHDAKQEAIHTYRLANIKEEAKLDYEMKLARKKRALSQLKNPHSRSKPSLNFGFNASPSSNKKKSKNAKKSTNVDSSVFDVMNTEF